MQIDLHNVTIMLPRAIRAVLDDRLALYPAVALDGPRQAGKTTLARSFGGRYFDLEQEGDRTRLDVQWPGLVAGRDLIILDEAQQHPEVFARVRGAIDEDRKRRGRFLILGSVSPRLKLRVAESLAGRLALVELTPLLRVEMPHADLDELWLRGGYPEGGVLDRKRFPQWHRDYLALLAQRDLPAWGLPAKPQVTDRLLRMSAVVHGQLWNASQIGQGLGLSHTTVNSYMDYLEGAFLVRRLRPYGGSLRKRLVRSPKVYWRDSGLLHALLGARGHDHLLAQPWVGASWEGFVIEQVLGSLQCLDRRVDASFFRTSDGHELDLLLDLEGERWAVEIKLTSQPSPEHLARLDKAADLVGARRRVLITRTRKPAIGRDRISCDLDTFLERLKQ
jgi:predicted AAA+ superfamily ATPase